MRILGLQKLSLLDFPGKVAATVFTGGCDLRCPFCHNAPLVLPGRGASALDAGAGLDFLARRRGLLGGVGLSGGVARPPPGKLPPSEGMVICPPKWPFPPPTPR